MPMMVKDEQRIHFHPIDVKNAVNDGWKFLDIDEGVSSGLIAAPKNEPSETTEDPEIPLPDNAALAGGREISEDPSISASVKAEVPAPKMEQDIKTKKPR